MTSQITRKSFLGLSGLGVGALVGAIPTLGPAAATPSASAGTAAAAAGSAGPIFSDSRFPIGLFWPPPPLETTVERYQEIADAGFTLVHGGNYTYADFQINRHLLAVAEQANLHVLVDDPDIRWLTRQFEIGDSSAPFTLSEDEVRQKVREVINRYAPQWQLSAGRLHITGGSGAGSVGWASAGSDWTDYTFAFDTEPVQKSDGEAQAGWAFRIKDEGNAYVWLLSSRGTDGKATLKKAIFVNGQPTVTSVSLPFAWAEGTAYRIETKVQGNTFTTSIDGVEVDVTSDATFTRGSAGFRQAGAEQAFFDNVTVTSPSGTELFSDDFSGTLDSWRRPAGSGNTSYAGLHLFDEPPVSKLPSLAKVVAIANEAYPDALNYVNLLPGFGAGYDQAAEQLPSPVVSFDRYPILAGGADDAGYFRNWADVRDAALAHDRESWVYIQSVGYNGHDVPTKADLLWQINISLAYGCKGIQYFTYWTPDPARGEGFHDGLITVDGQRTPLYRATKEVNTTYLAPIGRELRPLTSTAVQVAGVTPPDGLDPFAPDDQLTDLGGSPVVVGRFTDDNERGYALLANWSRTTTADVRCTFAAATEVFDPETGQYHAPESGRVRLPAGGAVLVRFAV